jgi:cytochrome c-type biogenesis protein CcsB
MDALVKLSFYCFTAASIAIAGAAICYVAYGIGRVRLRRTVLATSAGTTVSNASAELLPASSTLGRYGSMLAWFGVTFQLLAVVLRAIAAGRGPYANMYEFSLAFILAVTLIYLLFERSYQVKQLGAIVLPIALGMVVYVWSLPAGMREVDALNPALQNQPLLTVHVSVAILSYATFAVSFAAAIFYLAVTHWRISWLPSADMLDDIGYRSVAVGFPLLGLVIILGSLWAHRAWGSYWSWDPKETAALFTWLVYGVYLHTRSLRGWRGRRSALILIAGFVAVMFTYYGNYFFGGLHAYGGV